MKSFKKCIVFIPILCILFSVCTPFYANAYSRPFNFSITEPPVDNYHGYFVVPYYNSQLNIYQADLMYWVITPTVVDNNNTVPVATLDYNPLGNKFSLQFMTGQTDVAFTVAVYNTVGISPTSTSTQGNTYLKGVEIISYDDSPIFSFSYGSSISFYNPIFQGVTFLENESIPSSMGNASIVWGDDAGHYLLLHETTEKLIELVNGLDLTNEQLIVLYNLLNDYLVRIEKDTTSIVSLVDQFYYEWYQWTWLEQEFYERIIFLLEQAIQGEKPSNQDSFQDSYDDYADIEQGLINNEEASNAIGDFDVSIEGGAYSVIWNMITDFLNSNAKVFGLFIACLTLAFIALLLHR